MIAESQLVVDGVTRRIAHYQSALRLPAIAPSIAIADLAGRWAPGAIHHAPLDLLSMTVWNFDFDIDGNGSEKITDASLINNEYRFGWSAGTDAVMLRKYLVDPYYADDQRVITDARCSSEEGECPFKFQRWKPVVAVGGTYYFVEEVYESGSFPSLPLVRTGVAPLSLHRN